MRLRRSKVISSEENIEQLIAKLGRIWRDQRDRVVMADVIAALDPKYDLAAKIAREAGVIEIIEQMLGRIASALGRLSNVRGKRILDIACGSNTSRAPSSIYVNTPFGEKRIGRATNQVNKSVGEGTAAAIAIIRRKRGIAHYLDDT